MMPNSEYIRLRMLQQYKTAKAYEFGPSGELDRALTELRVLVECAGEYEDSRSERFGEWLTERLWG